MAVPIKAWKILWSSTFQASAQSQNQVVKTYQIADHRKPMQYNNN